jgi:hypothetical protein
MFYHRIAVFLYRDSFQFIKRIFAQGFRNVWQHHAKVPELSGCTSATDASMRNTLRLWNPVVIDSYAKCRYNRVPSWLRVKSLRMEGAVGYKRFALTRRQRQTDDISRNKRQRGLAFKTALKKNHL